MTVAPATEPSSPDEVAGGEARRRRAIFGLVLGFLAILVLIAVVQSITDSEDDTPATLPEATLVTLDGQEFELQGIVGEPTVLNFFASWCAPCRAELPGFQDVNEAVGSEVVFLGINTRETDVEAARRLISETGVTYTVALGDDGEVYQAVGGLAMPTTAFVNAEGEIVEVHSGILNAEDLALRIEEHFG